ncbi:hypothetical protein EC988_009528, partial [Linderina pennispora]
AIEHELDCLYDCYYEELEVSVRREKMRLSVLEAKRTASGYFNSVIDRMVDLAFNEVEPSQRSARMKVDYRREIQESFHRSAAAGRNPYILQPLIGDDAAESDSSGNPMTMKAWKTLESSGYVDQWTEIIMELYTRKTEYQREFGDKSPLDEDNSEDPLDNNDLFYTDNLLSPIESFPADSKKFFDMMERLADYRMRREDALLDNAADSELRPKAG